LAKDACRITLGPADDGSRYTARKQAAALSLGATRSIYLEPAAATELPRRCQVVGISPLMRRLLLEAVDLPVEYAPTDRAGLIMALLQQELRHLPVLPLGVPFSAKREARKAMPRIHGAAARARLARCLERRRRHEPRGFTRLFRRETGLSLAAWRQQACAVASLPRLAAGEAVTTVALDLGYEAPEAFTKMFKRVLGVPPSRYVSADGGEP